MCTALPLDEIYPPTKFHNRSFYSLGGATKFKYEKKKKKKQRAITQRLSKQGLRLICTALPLDEGICTGQKSSLKVNKGQSLKKKKKSKQELLFMCLALPLDEIYPPTKFHNHS